jgi:putative polyhydroxyalkanoate system protein
MSKPVTITIPHKLGQVEARRRIEESFGKLQDQMTGGLGVMKFERAWNGDHLEFAGGGLGQTIKGRLDVGPESVNIQIDLPMILAAIAEKIVGRLQQSTQKLLE